MFPIEIAMSRNSGQVSKRETERSGTPLTLSTLTSFICGIRDLRQGRLEIKVNSLTGTGKAEDLILLGVALLKV